MSHEQTITVTINGRAYNLPTVVNGQKVSPDKAVQLFHQGKLRPTGQASLEPLALQMAKERSHSFDESKSGSKNNLLDDLMGFFKENIQRAGTNAAASTQRNSDLVRRIERGEKVPTSGLLNEALNYSPAAVGSISPEMWKQITPKLKAAVNQLADQAPGFFERILKDPRELLINHMPTQYMPKALGQVARLTPNRNMLTIREDQLGAGKGLLDTIMHEMQHTLNIDRLAKMPKEDAATIGTLLKEEMEKGGLRHPSLASRIKEFERSAEITPKDPMSNLKEFGMSGNLSKEQWNALTPAEKARITTTIPEYEDAAASSKLLQEVFGYNKNEPYGDFLHRVIGDESLAHLSERTNAGRFADQGYTQSPFSDSDRLLDLAGKLGIGHEGFSPQDYMQAAKFPMEELTPAIKEKLRAAYNETLDSSGGFGSVIPGR